MRSELHYRLIVEAAPVVIYSLSREGKITSLNPAFEKITGWSCIEWIGRSFQEIVHPQDLTIAVETFQQVLRGESPSPYELRILAKSGEYLIGEFTSTQHIEDGEIVGELGIVCDVTERKRIESALKESENQYRAIFENTGTAMGISEEDGTISLVNTEFEKLAGYSKEEIEGKKSWTEFIVKEDLKRLKKYHNMRMKDPDSVPKNYEFRFITKDGNIKNIFTTVVMIPGTKKRVVSHLDITDRKQMEETLKKAYAELKEKEQELIQSEKLAALGRFSAGVAHEIRNPLGNITAAAQFCLSKYKDKLPELARKHCLLILKNSENANKIINELLNFAKPSGINLKIGDIKKVIDSTCDMVKTRALSHNVHITKKISRRLPKFLLDSEKLTETFLNFILNALDAMPDGGRLSITAYHAYKNNEVVISFSDTGNGIPRENLDKIFEPFFTTKENGVGLGLCLAHQIVSYHKGEINIKSIVRGTHGSGSGTEVIIRFPIPKERK